MTGYRLRITTLLLLLVAIVCSFSVGFVHGQAPLMRMLREQVQQNDGASEQHTTTPSTESNTHASKTDEATGSAHETTTGSAHETTTGSAHEATGSAHETTGSAHEPAHKEESLVMSFVGPACAGVLAIVLIGGVIAFKNRKSK